MNEQMKINVGVIFGGRSVEHEVSIISAHQAMAAMNKDKYRAIPIYISKEGQWYSGEALLDLNAFKNMPKLLKEAIPIEISANYGQKEIFTRESGLFKKPWSEHLDVVLPVVHGTSVEDGCLQGLLETAGIPYAGPAVLGSAVGMDKIMMKAVLREAGLPVVDYRAYALYQWQDDEEEVLAEIEKAFGYPLIIKPANLGSSIGITMVSEAAQLRDAVELAFSFSTRLIAEQAVTPLREINCAVLGAPGDLITSQCEEPKACDEILSFSDKYLASSTKGMSGAKRRLLEDEPELTAKIQDYAARAFAAMDCHGVCRVDFLLNAASGEIYVNELNTIPGSLSFYLFEPTGIPFAELVERLLRLALERKRMQERLTTVYTSNILAQGGFKGKK